MKTIFKILIVLTGAFLIMYGGPTAAMDVNAIAYETADAGAAAIFTFAKFLEEKGIKDDEFKEKEAAEQGDLYTQYLEKAQEKILEMVKEKAEASDIEKLEKEVEKQRADQVQKLEKSMREQGEVLKSLKEAIEKGINVHPETMATQIDAQKENMLNLAKAKTGKIEFEVKANFVRASVTNSTDAYRIDSIGQLAHRKLTIYDLFPKIPVGPNSNGTVRYSDWDEDTTVRAAAARAEGAAFPESTAKFAEHTMALQKIGDTIPISEEALYDSARFAAELDSFIATNVALKLDADLYSGNGTSPNIKGINTYAQTYTAAAAGITAPNIYDLVLKMAESMTKGKDSKYNPNAVLMNITDINAARLTKDANENYIIPPFVTKDGKQVDEITIIPCNNVTVNTCVLMDTTFGAIYEVEGYNVQTGWINAQFTSDLITLKAKKRCGLLVRDADLGGFLKCTSISGALTTLAS